MVPIELQKFRLSNKKHKQKLRKIPPPCHKQGERFLKGPIPLKWLIRASKLPGKSFHVAILICYRGGIEKSRTIKLSNITVKTFGLTRFSKKRALKHLESAGLITVERYTGRSPIVTILEI